MTSEYEAALKLANDTRAALFERWGAKPAVGDAETRLMPLAMTAMPNWPMREQYALLTIGRSTVAATDGLASPSIEDPRFWIGYGFELWAETDEVFADPVASWLVDLVRYVCRLVTEHQLGRDDIARLGMMSTEIPKAALRGAVAPEMLTSRDTLGVFIGAATERPEQLDAPLDDVRYYNVKLMTRDETEALMREGLAAAKRIAAAGTLSRLAR